MQPFSMFISLMEQTYRPSISFVIPMIFKMLAFLDPERPLKVVDREA
jgi:hypothetical protein